MPTDNTGAIGRFSGFAHSYDQFRPAPPDDFGPLLTQLTQIEAPELVIDIGCGTGLSTRYWGGRAARVVGVEPSLDMIAEARAQTPQPTISYLHAFGHQISLPDRCADIITCCDSLHWMEPEPTFSEIVRLLRPGGIFAWLHNDEPVVTPWLLDQAHCTFLRQSQALDEANHVTSAVLRWTRAEYISMMQTRFRHLHEFHLHRVLSANAGQYIGWVLTQGHVQSLLKLGISTEAIGLDELQTQTRRILGDGTSAWYWSAEVRVAIL
jgi:ubiquinone/menaquinone biosynthesis C-methylase UbiE